jgi:hypothetical protein
MLHELIMAQGMRKWSWSGISDPTDLYQRGCKHVRDNYTTALAGYQSRAGAETFVIPLSDQGRPEGAGPFLDRKLRA